MSRWMHKIPARDWSKWWYAYLSHAGTGLIASCGAILVVRQAVEEGPVWLGLLPVFLWLSAMVLWRQYVEFLRHNDTPGRDLQDHMIGYAAGAVVGLLSWWFPPT